MKTLRLILGDQLNLQHSWYNSVEDHVCYFMAEMRQETDYAPHHIQKVVAFFLAMREFAAKLEAAGHQVIYLKLDDASNTQDLNQNLLASAESIGASRIEYQWPDEYRLDQQLDELDNQFEGVVEPVDSEHFLTSRFELREFFKGKKTYLMESFYRMMRKKHQVLMEGDQPVTGQWNYDANNRKKLPKGHRPPEPKLFERDVSSVVEMLTKSGVKTIGTLDEKRFLWPVTEEEGNELLTFFVDECMPHFGDFQDAMTPEYWSLYHSRLSFLINSKIIHPMTVIRAVEERWKADRDHASISQVEGFIRQVLGWREYMRGIYWAKMPDYASLNFFEHDRQLPSWFWDGNTKMACLRHAIKQSLEYSYAHHIQRLMVTGNFALLAGIHPDEVDQWYLGIYIDAIEWVEITNTRGMSQFADGGIVGTKPYVSSANYMKKMSSYCDNCVYDHKKKSGEGACPFNSLYWNFYDRHRDKLGRNPRIGMMYRTWDKMAPENKAALLSQANDYLNNIEAL
ncbi:MAG: cryptochrome/photolyase family protein [Flavobacteriales bacterium]|nr:cryptochrome/photolyase family protein [Flavobacteriales bacterium]